MKRALRVPARRRFLGRLRHALLVLLAAAPYSGLIGASASPTRKRVMICLGPYLGRDPIDPGRKQFARLFAARGLVDGEHMEIAVVRPKKRKFDDAGRAEWEAIARRAVASGPDVILMHGPWLEFFPSLTRDIPLVFYGGVTDLAPRRRPSDNVTGVEILASELLGKRIELLKELHPTALRLGVVGVAALGAPSFEKHMHLVARRLGIEASFIEMPIDPPVEDVIRELAGARVEIADFLWNSSNPRLFQELVRLRVATSFPGRNSVAAGGLLCYVPKDDIRDDAVALAARILRGESVASLPVQQVREFYLGLNLGTARLLGLTVPPTMLVRAQEVIR